MSPDGSRDLIVTRRIAGPPIGDRWAIVVGISQYTHAQLNLSYADRDAREFFALIRSPEGGGFKRENVALLVNEDATTRNVTSALRTFLKKPDRHDLVVIYFACHGSPDPERPGNVYLLTHDVDPTDLAGTAVPMREIDLALRENLLAERVVIIADTCHSAAIGGGIGSRSATSNAAAVNAYLRELSATRAGVALLTSAEANEVSLEHTKWGGGHGVFTHYLLEGMRGAADTSPPNGIVTVGELFEYVRENVKNATDHRQHPAIGTTTFDRNLPMSVPGHAAATGQIAGETLADVDAADGSSARDAVSLTSPAVSRATRRFSRTWATVGAASILLVAVAAAINRPWRREPPAPGSKIAPVVEVLEFLPSGDTPEGQRRLGPWVQQDLAGTLADSGWQVVSRGAAEARRIERAFADSGRLAEATALPKEGSRATYVVGGRYEQVAQDSIGIDAYLVQIASGRVAASRSVRAPITNLHDGIRALAADLSRGTSRDSGDVAASSSSPRSGSVSPYVAGLLWLDLNQVTRARALFAQAVEKDSGYAPAASALRALSAFPKDSRPVIEVALFHNAGTPVPRDSQPDLGSLEHGLPDLLITEFASNTAIRVVDRSPQLLAEQSRDARPGKLLGASYQVAGSFMLLGKEWVVDAQINDLSSGLLRERFTVRAPYAGLLDAIGQLAVRLNTAASALPPTAPQDALDSLRILRARLGIPSRR